MHCGHSIPPRSRSGLRCYRWQLIYRVLQPKTVAAVPFGVGRAVGETMAVLMALAMQSIFQSTEHHPISMRVQYALTATIAELGELSALSRTILIRSSYSASHLPLICRGSCVRGIRRSISPCLKLSMLAQEEGQRPPASSWHDLVVLPLIAVVGFLISKPPALSMFYVDAPGGCGQEAYGRFLGHGMSSFLGNNCCTCGRTGSCLSS